MAALHPDLWCYQAVFIISERVNSRTVLEQ